jgi:hypothetical protein
LKAEGYTFPALRESDAMFAADRAPNWSDGDNCHRCRVQFSVIVRKVFVYLATEFVLYKDNIKILI